MTEILKVFDDVPQLSESSLINSSLIKKIGDHSECIMIVSERLRGANTLTSSKQQQNNSMPLDILGFCKTFDVLHLIITSHQLTMTLKEALDLRLIDI